MPPVPSLTPIFRRHWIWMINAGSCLPAFGCRQAFFINRKDLDNIFTKAEKEVFR